MAEHPAIAALPAIMRRAVEECEIREAQEAEARQAQLRDEADAKALMAAHTVKNWIASTGYSPGQWRAFQAARIDALAGFDPSAPIGSERHPAVIIDGEDISTPRAVADSAAQRYESAGIGAQLRRHHAERAAWNSAPIRRQREICLNDQIRRHGLPPASHPAARQADLWPDEPREIRRRGASSKFVGGLELQRFVGREEAEALTGQRRTGDY